MTEDTVVAVGKGKIATWNLPSGDCTFHTNINNTLPFTTRGCSLPHDILGSIKMSISPDLGHVVAVRATGLLSSRFSSLEVYSVSTGMRLAGTKTIGAMTLLFAQDGHEVWAGSNGSFREQSKIIEDSKSGTIELNTQTNEGQTRVIFRESPHGHEVTDDGWVLSPTRKRLLWLPHHWRSRGEHRKWGGRFLGLLHRDLPEVVILEFFE